MNKWCFSVSSDALDSLPEIFRDSLIKRLMLDEIRLNKNDDEGWLLTASYQGFFLRIICRNQLVGENVENVLWCEGVQKSVISFFDKKLPPPPALVAAIADVLNNDVGAKDVEKLVE